MFNVTLSNYSPVVHFGQKHIALGIKVKFNRLFAPQMVFSRSGQISAAARKHHKKYCLPLPDFGKGSFTSRVPGEGREDGFSPKVKQPVSSYQKP